MEFLEKIDQVEVASVSRVEEGGLFKGMPKTELLKRAKQKCSSEKDGKRSTPGSQGGEGG